nr:hypothetical protein [Enterovibrio nigricans]
MAVIVEASTERNHQDNRDGRQFIPAFFLFGRFSVRGWCLLCIFGGRSGICEAVLSVDAFALFVGELLAFLAEAGFSLPVEDAGTEAFLSVPEVLLLSVIRLSRVVHLA